MYSVRSTTSGQESNTRHPSPRRGIPTENGPLERRITQSQCTSLDLFLKRSHWVGFHNCPCWLLLHFGLLAEHHPHTCFRGWFGSGLDAANAWDREHARLLHFCRGNGHEAVEHLGTSLLLQAVFGCNCLCESTLCHGLGTFL